MILAAIVECENHLTLCTIFAARKEFIAARKKFIAAWNTLYEPFTHSPEAKGSRKMCCMTIWTRMQPGFDCPSRKVDYTIYWRNKKYVELFQ